MKAPRHKPADDPADRDVFIMIAFQSQSSPALRLLAVDFDPLKM
jgi:hypothetical protein